MRLESPDALPSLDDHHRVVIQLVLPPDTGLCADGQIVGDASVLGSHGGHKFPEPGEEFPPLTGLCIDRGNDVYHGGNEFVRCGLPNC